MYLLISDDLIRFHKCFNYFFGDKHLEKCIIVSKRKPKPFPWYHFWWSTVLSCPCIHPKISDRLKDPWTQQFHFHFSRNQSFVTSPRFSTCKKTPPVALEWHGRIPDLNLVNLQLSDTRLFSVLVIVPLTPWVWIRKFGLTPPSVINEPCLLQQRPKIKWNLIGHTRYQIRKRTSSKN